MRISVPASGLGADFVGEPGLGVAGRGFSGSRRCLGRRRGAALLLLERKRAVAGENCRNQRQRNYEPASHSETPQRHLQSPRRENAVWRR